MNIWIFIVLLVSSGVVQAGTMKTAHPQRGDFPETGRWFGTVESPGTLQVIAPKNTQIASVDVEDGSQVEKGESLFTFNDPLVKSRMDALQQSGGVRTDFLSAALHLRAPITGRFTRRRVAAGQMIRSGDLLAEMIPLNQLVIVASLFPENDTKLAGLSAEIRSPSGKTIRGKVHHVLPERTADGATRVWIVSSDSQPPLHPGETVSGSVLYSLHRDALCLPESAVLRDERDQAWVMVKTDSGILRRQVETGRTSEHRIEIRSGLRADDDVVITGAYELFNQNFTKTYKVVD